MRQKSKGFDFKQFSIRHDRCAMKVGTDAVLLGTWVEVEKATRILDIGTGSGIIALMLAQRSANSTLIDALEPDLEASEQARTNVLATPWNNRITIHQTKLQQFHPSFNYDLIVSNPPYFVNSYVPANINRKLARHSETLSHLELIHQSSLMLNPQGRMAVILPYTEGEAFLKLASEHGFQCNRKLAVFARKEKKQERWIFEFSFSKNEPSEEILIIHEGTDNQWSTAYKTLTKDFYLYL